MADLGQKTTGTILDESGLEMVRRTLAERAGSGEPIAHTLALNLLATVDGLRESLDEGEPSTPEGGDTARQQVDRLTRHILKSVQSEPSQSEGAIDTAIRLLTDRESMAESIDALKQKRDGLLRTLRHVESERDDGAAAVDATLGDKARLVSELESITTERDAYLLELKEIGEQVGLEQDAVGNMLPATGFVKREVEALHQRHAALIEKITERPVDRDLRNVEREREIMRHELTQVWKALGQNPDEVTTALDALEQGEDTEAREGFISETVVATVEKLLADGQKYTSLRREFIEQLGIANLGISDDDLVEFIVGRQGTDDEALTEKSSELEDARDSIDAARAEFTKVREDLAKLLGWDSATLGIDQALEAIGERIYITPDIADLKEKLRWHGRTIDTYKRAIRALGSTVNELADSL